MHAMQRLLSTLVVVALSSCAIQTHALRGQYDKRVERLQKERDKLNRQTDPVDRTKTYIAISEILLSLASDSVKNGEPEALGKHLTEYLSTVRDAHQTMMKTGRDAHRKPKGFKELEIALRRQIRMLDDLGRTVTYDHRDPVDKAKAEVSGIREDVFRALFGEQNAPSRKS
jgi:hypothetical protein